MPGKIGLEKKTKNKIKCFGHSGKMTKPLKKKRQKIRESSDFSRARLCARSQKNDTQESQLS